MDTAIDEKPTRQRMLVYLRPETIRWLRRERGETDKPVGRIIEDALRPHIEAGKDGME